MMERNKIRRQQAEENKGLHPGLKQQKSQRVLDKMHGKLSPRMPEELSPSYSTLRQNGVSFLTEVINTFPEKVQRSTQKYGRSNRRGGIRMRS